MFFEKRLVGAAMVAGQGTTREKCSTFMGCHAADTGRKAYMDHLPQETLTLEQVQQRVPLLKRVVRDAAAVHESRKKSKEFLEELLVISKKFTSTEINETIARLRRDIAQYDRDLETYRNEVRALGGVLRDEEQGLTYFAAEREDREIYLIWELDEPDLISWHGREQTPSDRVPVEFPEGSQTPG